MVRRLYEEDSSVEESEDYPLYRTPRLYGGQGPAGEEDVDDPDSPDEDEDAYSVADSISSNSSKQMDQVGFMWKLCGEVHSFEDSRKLKLRHRCRGCNKRKLTALMVQCSVCKMYAHEDCSTNKLEEFPLPCIPATPIANAKKPNLKECTAVITHSLPKVPAILVKCFHELQKKERISSRTLYPLLADIDLAGIEPLSARLCRHVNRNLGNVHTFMISGCVLKFLFDIRDQLLSPEEEHYLISLEQQLGQLEEENRVVLRRAGDYVRNFEPHRLHTMAALFLHICNVYAFRDENLMSSDRVYTVFGDVFKPIKILFEFEIEYWREMLR